MELECPTPAPRSPRRRRRATRAPLAPIPAPRRLPLVLGFRPTRPLGAEGPRGLLRSRVARPRRAPREALRNPPVNLEFRGLARARVKAEAKRQFRPGRPALRPQGRPPPAFGPENPRALRRGRRLRSARRRPRRSGPHRMLRPSAFRPVNPRAPPRRPPPRRRPRRRLRALEAARQTVLSSLRAPPSAAPPPNLVRATPGSPAPPRRRPLEAERPLPHPQPPRRRRRPRRSHPLRPHGERPPQRPWPPSKRPFRQALRPCLREARNPRTHP